MRLYFILILFSLCAAFAEGQSSSPRFQYITTEQGLSQNSINHIYQDEFGFLWFATQDGLNRYDGYEFTVYKPDKANPWSISDNFITRIVPAEDGNMWVLCRYGLNYFERKTGRFYKLYSKSSGNLSIPTEVLRWHNRWVAIITQELYVLPDTLFHAFDTLSSPLMLADSILVGIAADSELYLMTNSELMLFDDNANIRSTIKLPQFGRSYDRFFRDNEDVFLFISNVLYRLESDSLRLEPIVSFELNYTIQDVCFKRDSSIWIGHTAGLTILREGKRTDIRASDKLDGGLSYPLVHSVFEDVDGNMWVGTANGGLNIIPNGAERFSHLSREDGLTHNQVWCAFEDQDKNLWIGTEMGLSVMQNGERAVEYDYVTTKFKKTRITAITQDVKGRIWIGTSVEGLYRLDHMNRQLKKFELEGSSKYFQSVSCFQEQGDTMWVGTLGTLSWVDEHDQLYQFSDTEEKDNREIYYVLSLRIIDDELHIGSAVPYHILDTKTLKTRHFVYAQDATPKGPSFQFCTGIEPTRESDIWLSTFGGGLNRFDRVKDEFEYFSKADGLGNDVLAAMLKLGDYLWISHNNGISRFNIETNVFTNYDVTDGIPFKEFSLGAKGIMHDGRIVFGGTNGLVMLDPADFDSEEFSKKPEIIEFQVNYSERDFVSNSGIELSLTPSDRVISFRFAAFDFIHSKQFQYEYKLEGFDREWVKSSVAERRATYSNLSSGDYTFKVRVANQNGQWSSRELIVPITVIPPLWQRWWFLSLSAIVVLLLIALFTWYLSQIRLKRKLRELETKQRIHKERERISMDLHDHVGAQISFLISNLDRMDLEGKGEKSRLSGLGKYAREAMRELRDTVWAIRDDQMSVTEVANRIRAFGEDLFGESNTTISVQTIDVNKQWVLDPSPSLHLLRILQESLHNVFKHANATKTSIEFVTNENDLTVVVMDDGVGFSQNNEQEGMHNGLRNMQERASQMGAIFTVISKKNAGTEIRITMKVAPSNELNVHHE